MKLLKRRLLLCSHNYRSFSLKIILPKPNLLCISLFQRAKKRSRDMSVWPQRVGDFYRCKWSLNPWIGSISSKIDKKSKQKSTTVSKLKSWKSLKSQIFTLEDGNFRVIFHAWIPYPFIFKQLCKFSGCKKILRLCHLWSSFPPFPLNPFSTNISGYNCQFYTIFSRTRNDLQNE